jgi:cobaltochelatase CobN
VLQLVLSGGTEADWAAGVRGVGPRDSAKNVPQPEVDGRVLAVEVSF